jgi:hypothetical protein
LGFDAAAESKPDVAIDEVVVRCKGERARVALFLR